MRSLLSLEDDNLLFWRAASSALSNVSQAMIPLLLKPTSSNGGRRLAIMVVIDREESVMSKVDQLELTHLHHRCL